MDHTPLGKRLSAALYLDSGVEIEAQEDAEHATWSSEANGDQI